MNVADMIRQALEKKGYRNLKDASKDLGISPELLRVALNKGHIPKDKTLILIAGKLGLDTSTLILAAHQEKVPEEVKGFFLTPSIKKSMQGRRVAPLSAEQCDYLEKVMVADEIQLMRKYRQFAPDAKTQLRGYVDYMFSSKRKP